MLAVIFCKREYYNIEYKKGCDNVDVRKLYISIHEEDVEQKDVKFENLGCFFDKESRIGVQKIYIEYDLKVGIVYDFTYEDYNDIDTYYYLVLKKEENVYYIAEYYDKFYKYDEMSLGNSWEKCNIKEKLGIDIEKWENTKIYNIQMPDMREKVVEYIGELEMEIKRLEDHLEERMNDEACRVTEIETRMETLQEVINDLKGRLEERI